MTNKDELIKAHAKIQIHNIKVLRKMNLTLNDCSDEGVIRRFCADNKVTLPDMIEIEVVPFPEDNTDHEWQILIYENPNERGPS